jgi:protein-disulfide isomerase
MRGKVVPIYDVEEMVRRGVTASPAVIVNGKIVLSGSIPSVREAKEWLR